MQRAKSEKKNDALIASGESNISIFCEKSGGKLEAGSRDYVVVMSALIHFSILFFSFLIGSAIMEQTARQTRAKASAQSARLDGGF